MFIIVGYTWCPHYVRVRDTVAAWPVEVTIIGIDESGAEGKRLLVSHIETICNGKQLVGLPVHSTSPQIFIQNGDTVYCVGGESEFTPREHAIRQLVCGPVFKTFAPSGSAGSTFATAPR